MLNAIIAMICNYSLLSYIVVQLVAKLLEVPILHKPTSALLNKIYASIGFNLAKTVKDEINNSQRLCAIVDFKFNTKNLTLIGDKKLPILLGFSLNDHMVQHAIFNEMSPLLGLKTLPEMAKIKDAQGNKNYHDNNYLQLRRIKGLNSLLVITQLLYR